MKDKLSFPVWVVAAVFALGVRSARGNLEVSASVNIHAAADFYAPLAPDGAWVTVGSYGRCWHPRGVAVGWRPYCDGSWEWTDCGWYWQSDEPWAWACYHYGSWTMDPTYGWIWVPGVEWGPAWVSWRLGAGYIGWAPLSPRGVAVAVGGPAFVFVKSDHFEGRIRPSTVVVNNTTIIKRTTVVNNMKRESRNIGGGRSQTVMVNEGPGLDTVQKATGRKFKQVSIREAAGQTHMPAGVSAGIRNSTHPEKPSAAPAKQPPPTVAPKAVPGGRGEPPDAMPHGESGHGAGKASPRQRPGPAPGRPPASPHGPPAGKHEGHGHEKKDGTHTTSRTPAKDRLSWRLCRLATQVAQCVC